MGAVAAPAVAAERLIGKCPDQVNLCAADPAAAR